VPPRPDRGAAIETTGYAMLALLQGGDRLNAGRAVRWLTGQRNAFGGFGSTQDTIVALQAMTTAATTGRADIDASSNSTAARQKTARITRERRHAPTDRARSAPVDDRDPGKGTVTPNLSGA
jgi:hypothetical protein